MQNIQQRILEELCKSEDPGIQKLLLMGYKPTHVCLKLNSLWFLVAGRPKIGNIPAIACLYSDNLNILSDVFYLNMPTWHYISEDFAISEEFALISNWPMLPVDSESSAIDLARKLAIKAYIKIKNSIT